MLICLHEELFIRIIKLKKLSKKIFFRQLNVQHDAQIWFNVSLPPKVKLVLYARLTLSPTPAVYDFQRIISADRLHVSGKRPPRHLDNTVIFLILKFYFLFR